MKPYKAEDLPPVASWRGRFDYDASTGAFTFVGSKRRGWNGKAVGTLGTSGYLIHKLNGTVSINVHRLIWAWVTGEWPGEETVIDHVNRDLLDNRWVNLRAATYAQNEANSRAKNKLGRPKGLKLHKHGKWEARVTRNYHQYYLGLYDTMEEALEAYRLGSQRLFGEEWATSE